MSTRNKRKPPVDARVRAKGTRAWTAARLPMAHQVAVGDDFDRPDIFVWLDDEGTLAARALPHDAPDDAIVALYEEAVLHARGGTPTVVLATEPELVAALKDKLPRRPPVRLDVDALRGRDLRMPAHVAPHDDGDPDQRPLLQGARVSADALGSVVRALARLQGLVPWTALPPWAVEFVLRAPARGVPDASVTLTHDEVLSVARSVAARDDALTWPRRQRPRGTFFLDAVFQSAADAPQVAREAVAHGWREDAPYATVVSLRAADVEDFPRPLVPSDLDLARLAVEAIERWYAEERRLDLWRPTPVAVAVAPDVTLEVRTTRIVALEADDEDDWIELWGPSVPTFERARRRHEALLATLRDAGDLAPRDLEARVAAAGVDAVPALCDALAEALAPDTTGSPWHAPWLLLALGCIGDLRALPYVVVAGVLHGAALGDALTECLPGVLAGFGPPAIPQLTDLLASPRLDPYLRVAAGVALFAIGVDHPAARPKVAHTFAALFDWLEESTDPDATVATLLAARAVRTGDDEVFRAVEGALEGGWIDTSHINAGDLARIRAEARWTRDEQADLAPVAAHLRRPFWCA